VAVEITLGGGTVRVDPVQGSFAALRMTATADSYGMTNKGTGNGNCKDKRQIQRSFTTFRMTT
jgi:hypothetical protein